jgi:hypothetical protein
MGANSSKQEVYNETLNDIQIEVMTKNSTSMNSSTTQSNVYYINNDSGDVNVDGVTQENISKIDLSSLANTTNNANLQAELFSKIKQAAEQELPSIALGSTTDQTIKNSIKNIIGTKMSTENLTKLAASTTQHNEAGVNNSGKANNSTVRNFKQNNSSGAIMKLTNSTSTEIIQAIKAVADIDSSNIQKQAGFLPDFGQMAIIAIVIIAALFLGGGQVFSKSLETITKPVPMAFAAMIVLIIVYIVFSQSKPEEVKSKPETFLSGNAKMQKRSYGLCR